MNTKKVIGMLLLAVFCVVGFRGNAQQVVPIRFNVYISVQCADKVTELLIRGNIQRELRLLGDVLVENPNVLPTHTLRIVAIELTRGPAQVKTGAIAISAVFTEFIRPDFEKYCHGTLLTGHINELPLPCRDAVIAFDITTLQNARGGR